MRPTHLFVIPLLFILAGVACLKSPAQSGSKDVLFADDFSTTGKKWEQVTCSSCSSDYYNGGYRIAVNDPYIYAWAQPRGETFTDIEIEVDATKNGGPDNNGFGIICRYVDAQKFYFAFISSDGYYAIMKMTAAGEEPIGHPSMLETDRIITGPAANHIRMDCVGSTLTLYINGYLVDQQTDTDYSTGNIGVIAGTFYVAGTDILFDNFFVFRP